MISNFFKHLKKVLIHKFWVAYYCFKCGFYWRGLIHDLSKFHPIEFLESVKYYQGNRSPIDAAKEDKGYSSAWYHHRGRNKHHYEYWCDNFENGLTCPPMPYEYTVELLCDYLGAARAYMGKEFTYQCELDWWNNVKKDKTRMNKKTKEFITQCFNYLVESGVELDKNIVLLIYKNTHK